MKSLLIPLVACAALAGCADYGTVAYGSYPAGGPYGTAVYGTSPAYPYAYGSSPAYPYAYGTSPAYPYSAYGWPGSGFAYGGPAIGLTIDGGRFRDGHRGGGDWRGGDRRGATAGMTHRSPDTNAMGAGPARIGRGNGLGRRMGPRAGGPRQGGGAGHHEQR